MADPAKPPMEAGELFFLIFLAIIVLMILAIALHDPVVRALVIFNFHLLTWIDAVGDFEVVKASIAALKTVKDVKELTWGDAFALTRLTGEYIRWLVVPPLLLLGTWLLLADPLRRYRAVKTMQTLIADKAQAFPVIRPVVGLNLLHDRHYRDAWAPMLNPFEWCIKHGVLLERTLDEAGRWETKPLTMAVYRRRKLDPDHFSSETFVLDEKRVESLFRDQLGAQINPTGEPPKTAQEILDMLLELPGHYRALIAVMLMRYVGGRAWRERSYALIEQLANSYYVDPKKSYDEALDRLKKRLGPLGLAKVLPWLAKVMVWLKKRPDFTVANLNIQGVDDIIRTLVLKDDAEVQSRLMMVFRRRAWANTMMIDLLERAREYGGILITADFIWLKPVDRQLFYVLNSTGRKTVQVEAAGAFAHYYAEMVLDKPFPTPEVDTAVHALRKILIKEGWLPDPQEAKGGRTDPLSKQRMRILED